MNNHIAMMQNQLLTMTTMELSILSKSDHSATFKSATRLSAQLSWGLASTEENQSGHKGGRPKRYYTLNKNQSLTLVAQLNPQFLAYVVDRWLELESTPKIPQTLSEALRLAADQAETIEAQQLKIETDKPKVDFADKYAASGSCKGFRAVAKLLRINEKVFRTFLVKNTIMYSMNREWVAYSEHIKAKRFSTVAGVSDEGHAFNSIMFTPKGIQWIAQKLSEARLINE